MTAARSRNGEGGREHRRHGRRRRRAARRAEPGDAAEPTSVDPYEEARLRAKTKAKFARDLVEFAVVVGVLLLVIQPVGVIVGLFWGIGLASDFAKKILEPALRQRWVEREVQRRLRHTVPEQRREIEGQHARRIEEIAAGVAHEIRNPITAAKSLVQQMGEDPASSENVAYAKVTLDELNRVERSVSHLLRFAREEDVHFAEMRISEVITSALETVRERLEKAGVRTALACDATGSMRGDPEQLRRVVINLVGNALEALEEARPDDPCIQIQAGENLAGSEVWIRVRDNGPGIEPERLQRIFSPFYTSKASGTGLGLAMSKKVVEAHGGTLEADSTPERGTQFLLTLPKRGGSDAELPS